MNILNILEIVSLWQDNHDPICMPSDSWARRPGWSVASRSACVFWITLVLQPPAVITLCPWAVPSPRRSRIGQHLHPCMVSVIVAMEARCLIVICKHVSATRHWHHLLHHSTLLYHQLRVGTANFSLPVHQAHEALTHALFLWWLCINGTLPCTGGFIVEAHDDLAQS
jgi:hypothetical protein